MTQEPMSRYEVCRALLVNQKTIVDRRDEHALRNIYTREAHLKIVTNGKLSIDLRGRDKIIAFMVEGWRRSKPEDEHLHLVTNVSVEDGGDDRVKGHSYQIYMSRKPGDHRILGFGIYNDIYAFEDGAWRLQERLVEITSEQLVVGAPQDRMPQH